VLHCSYAHRFFFGCVQCDTDECTEAHTNVDIVVDLAELRALLKHRLPYVWAGSAVEDAALPWPTILEGMDTTI